MNKDLRLAALRRFAIAITVLNIAGQAFLGFEPSIAQVLVSVGTSYTVELLLELVQCRANGTRPKFMGGVKAAIDFLLPSHITGLAVGMLLYSNEQLLPIVFAATTAIGSKAIFRVRVGSGTRHFFNPSNAGISLALLLFPWLSIAPPYQFSEQLSGVGHWILPGVFIFTGSLLNARFTRRIPLIAAWLTGFFMQAVIRNLIFGTSWLAGLAPMTGIAFLLFTFYMISDPGTTPVKPKNQLIFGAGVAAAYGLLLVFHIAFGLFFSLVGICMIRGCLLSLNEARARIFSMAPQPQEPVTALLREG